MRPREKKHQTKTLKTIRLHHDTVIEAQQIAKKAGRTFQSLIDEGLKYAMEKAMENNKRRVG
jgi:hypothetical protein